MQMLRGMFGILMTLLNSAVPVTREELAEKFEISKRTVSRYIDAMSARCGVPLTVSYGTGGGYSLADNFKLNQTFFTVEEYERILSCLNAVDFDDEIMTSVRDKFAHLKSNAEGEKFLVKTDRLVIDSTSWLNPKQYRNTMSVINKAIDLGGVLLMTYADKHDRKTERKFDPYTLVLKEGVWYVYGWCHARKDFRLFKLSRIRTLSLTADTFSRHEGGDVYEKLGEEFIDREKINITIEFDETALPAVEEWLDPESIKTKSEGVYTACGRVYSEDLLLDKLLSFGSHVKVTSPRYVAEELQTELKRALESYAPYKNE